MQASRPIPVLAAIAALLLGFAACKKPAEASGSATAQAAAGTAAAGAAAPAAAPPEDLFAFSAGTRFVQKPDDADYAGMAYTPYNLIDETPVSDTRAELGKPAVYVLELPEKTEIASLGFDNAGLGHAENSVKGVTVEVSDTSATTGYTQVLATDLKMDMNGQDATLPKPVTGRWVRLTLTSNHGGTSYGITGFRGYGRRLTETAKIDNVSGTYLGGNGWGHVHLKQEGTRVVGCFDYRHGLIAAGVEGRLLKGEMVEHEDDGAVAKRSLALFAFAPGNKALFALSRATDSNPEYGYDSYWGAEKESDDIGDCPGIPGWRGKAAQSQLGAELQQTGRARLDGVNFDFNSATIQAGSYPLLDQVAGLLTEHADWKIALEGHTDNIGGPAFNKTLSGQRAAAVQAYLVSKGVAAARLSSSGFGFDKPVASNNTQGGRAQNRRVEIVKS